MTNEPLVFGLAAVFAAITAVMVGLTVHAKTPIPLFVAVACGVTASLMWYHASGRLERRVFRTGRRRGRQRFERGDQRRRAAHSLEAPSAPTQETIDAHRVLGVELGADRTHIQRAYRERAKRTHPDRSGGSEAEFKRVTDAYERLIGR